MSATKAVVVSKIDVATAQVKRKDDVVAREVPLHVFLGAVHFVSILCSPILLKELVVGHLLGEGLVNSVDEIVDVNFESTFPEKVVCFKTASSIRESETNDATICS